MLGNRLAKLNILLMVLSYVTSITFNNSFNIFLRFQKLAENILKDSSSTKQLAEITGVLSCILNRDLGRRIEGNPAYVL
ncbi:hypothetical protein C437_04695 [Haloarcula vallismortis ATCC 29715]|uniref:Uncharacterized protein n=1 Tax=Haloarcula vallismortis ATCC 29715 TaxID=662477 RepID=M0JLN7_HALVA|nr:hypothetical protein C437_04695 [Haloarcula vallismortis ATCC 29715]